jgi:rod shape-determining protein MreC
MDFLLNRYRNLTVLLVVIVVQLLLLAYQVKTNKDLPLMRVWAVSAVTPVEQGLEFVRRHTFGLAGDYFNLVHVRENNDKLQKDVDHLKLENHYLRNELSTADRVKELDSFRQVTPSKTLVASAIGNGTGANSKTIFVDRGMTAGVEKGMAVITPDGIVGKVVSTYPTASLVMLMTDPSFAAGVVSQKNHVHGTLKGLGGPKCRVD